MKNLKCLLLISIIFSCAEIQKNVYDLPLPTFDLKINPEYLIDSDTVKNSYRDLSADRIDLVTFYSSIINPTHAMIAYKIGIYDDDCYWADPQETYQHRYGDCKAIAIFVAYVLVNYYNVTSNIIRLYRSSCADSAGHMFIQINIKGNYENFLLSGNEDWKITYFWTYDQALKLSYYTHDCYKDKL